MKKSIMFLLVAVMVLVALMAYSKTEVFYDGEAELEAEEISDGFYALYLIPEDLISKPNIFNATATLTFVGFDDEVLETREFQFQHLGNNAMYFLTYYYMQPELDEIYLKITGRRVRAL